MPKYHPLLKTLPIPDSDMFVYGLIDPRNGELKYIGQTKRGLKRIKEHYHKCERSSNKLKNWQKKLKKLGLIFDVIYLEYTQKSDNLDEIEIFYYNYFKSIGCDLLNFYYPGTKYMDSNKKIEISEATKLAMKRPEVKQKLKDSHIGQISPMKGKKHKKSSLNAISKNNKNMHYIKDEFNNYYAGVDSCAEYLNINRNVIQHYLKGRTKTAKGHHFEYINIDLIKGNIIRRVL